MKLLNLVPLASLVALAATASCSQEGLDNGSTSGKGSGATSGTGMTPMGGTGGSMGGTGTGGSMGGTGTGGSMGGTGTSGAAMMGGSSGSGTNGGSGPAGMAGTGNTGASGGSSGSGTMGGTAGMTTGGGAGVSMGGMSSGGMAGSGVAGSGMAGTGTGGAGDLDPATIVPDLDGFYWEDTCKNTADGHNCSSVAAGMNCPSGGDFYSQGINIEKSIKVKGTAGTKYTLNVEIRGVAGGRCYTGGTPGTTSGADLDQNNNNGWYAGGKQLNDSIWNTYEIHVENPTVDGAPNVYFANSVQPVANPDAFPSGTGNNCQMEMTIGYSYMASFQVMGDSTIRFLVHDSNCKGQQNCGKTASTVDCSMNARTVNMSGMSPAPTFTQPVTNSVGSATLYPQWLYFDVKTITSP